MRADLPPGEHFISEYARGSTAPLQAAAFLAWAVAFAAAAWLAARAPRRPIARALTTVALAVAAAGTVVATLFATQTVAGELQPGVQRTLEGRLHDLGTLLLFAGLIVAALASVRLVPRARFRVTVALLALALVATVPVLVALRLDLPGIGQRAFVLIGCAWAFLFAVEVPSRGTPLAVAP
ncbi:MAG: DUF998 domain-containing protein [Solirubrobacteraceae bacterium MAG38_C4-C5]|nr:DUF998 domain-containing protein [Candidatus Siliceabacter maunaloa]